MKSVDVHDVSEIRGERKCLTVTVYASMVYDFPKPDNYQAINLKEKTARDSKID